MMNMDAENTALLIRSLLACIKQHESTLSAALFKLAEKTKTIEQIIEDLRDQLDLIEDMVNEMKDNQCECDNEDSDEDDDYGVDDEDDSD